MEFGDTGSETGAGYQSAEEPYVVFFDLETQEKISAMPGQSREDKFRCCKCRSPAWCACPLGLRWIQTFVDEAIGQSKRHTVWRDELYDEKKPFDVILNIFDKAELICGYNVFAFDFLVLRKHYAGNALRYYSHCSKTVDPFSRLRDVTGVWFKLGALLKENGLETKTADGLEAIKMWENGERAKLAEYCMGDTVQTARLVMKRELTLPLKWSGVSVVMSNRVFRNCLRSSR